ncbi:MAG: ATP synthase F1 subunit epsilon [Firmicutes bacterium]|nr:ATP synthase F1 subunit epsilon [Bacillota bacterium]
MAENKIRLRIVTPVRELYNDEADMVIMRSTSGDIGIMHGHQPLTTTLGYGVLKIMKDGEDDVKAVVFGGYVDVQPECITILSDAAEWPDEIDVKRAEEAKERAERRLNGNREGIDILRAELALRRALIRIDEGKR